jgi:hypothetical protein
MLTAWDNRDVADRCHSDGIWVVDLVKLAFRGALGFRSASGRRNLENVNNECV